MLDNGNISASAGQEQTEPGAEFKTKRGPRKSRTRGISQRTTRSLIRKINILLNDKTLTAEQRITLLGQAESLGRQLERNRVQVKRDNAPTGSPNGLFGL